MKGFKEIYENPEKQEMEDYLCFLEKKVEDLFLNKELTTFTALSVHRLIYVIEKTDITANELRKNIYYLTYYFLKDYINVKELIKLSGFSENELKDKSQKSLELIKKYYKVIEKKELEITKIFYDIKRFAEWKQEQKEREKYYETFHLKPSKCL
jgi:hypothetical protein